MSFSFLSNRFCFASYLTSRAILAATVGLSMAALNAQDTKTSSSPLIGFEKLPIQGKGESRLGLPLVKAPVFIGRVGAVGATSLKVSGANWSPMQFKESAANQPRFYAEIATGALNGLILPIVNNEADELEVSAPIPLTAHPNGIIQMGTAGDLVQIRPCYQVQEIFGENATESVLTPVVSMPARGDNVDRIQLPDNESSGYFKSPKDELFYLEDAGWRSIQGGGAKGEHPFLPGDAFTVQMFSGAGTDLYLVGHVEEPSILSFLPASTSGTELLISVRGSEPLPLATSNLVESNAFASSDGERDRADELLWFDSSKPGYERVPDRQFIHLSGLGWVELGPSNGVSEFRLQPGEAFLLRRKDASDSAWWVR